jgi:dTDP-4-dehydrorhamnose reductase
MTIAVSGANGRLGRALLAALGSQAEPWTRPEIDLDRPETLARLVHARRPAAVVHAAAWTDVDGCARNPTLAMIRNRDATAAVASACRDLGADLVYVSTNEVFDGHWTNGRGFDVDDATNPASVYGASKLAGEDAARAAFAAGPDRAVTSPRLGIVRTAWLFGPGAPDFPRKILAAAERARTAGEPLRVVADEWGNPTYVADLAGAIVELLRSGVLAGTHHVVNGLFASRSQWAMYVLARAGLDVRIEEVPSTMRDRPSTPPRWGVLASSPLPSGRALRPWPDAMAAYAPLMLARARPT